MPIPFQFEILKTPSVTRIPGLALPAGSYVAWTYNGVVKNLQAKSQPLALVGFRQIVEGSVADDLILRRVPLTALGQVRIGTIWANNMSHTSAKFEEFDFEVDFRGAAWQHTSFFYASPSTRTTPYPMELYPLKHQKDKNWNIEFKLQNGGKLVVPCLEFYSRCYGRSEELNRILATYGWDEVNKRFYAPLEEPEESGKWKVKLRKRLHNGDTVFLAHAKYDPYTQRVAREIYGQLESQFVPRNKAPSFLKVAPWFQGPAELRCQGIWFDNQRSFLALRVIGGSDPDGILIERGRENTNKNIEGNPDLENDNAWEGAIEKRLIRPPDIVDLTGDDEPNHGTGAVEILDPKFVVLGIPRAVVDRHGERISSSSKNRRKGGNESTNSSGERHGSGSGIGYASIHAPVHLESHGALLDMWNATSSLKKKHPELIQTAEWFTFADGYRSDGNPKLIALEPIDEEEIPTTTRNWVYFDVKTARPRGLMVLRITSRGRPIYIVEIERRPRKVANQSDVEKEGEEAYRGVMAVIEDSKIFEQWLRRFMSDVRYIRGIVSKLIPHCPGLADTFTHPKTRGEYILGEAALLQALEKAGITPGIRASRL
ncbi:hypothetical protein [Azospira restricta]|uniref:Uncharacterized protein n=1 Tax=Azospira restricta TaxID=404405 RepID=A0A974SQ81_9RHOO|nr:hypothetical protein [Azospira restricta]QRJ64442.1 hypothetical protein IWH25_03575 [Azospira restricta]